MLCTELLHAEVEDEEGGNLARKVGEAVSNTLGAVATAIDIPLGELCNTRARKNCVMGNDCRNLNPWTGCHLVAYEKCLLLLVTNKSIFRYCSIRILLSFDMLLEVQY